MKLGINYEACFPKEIPKTLLEYLSGIDKSTLLKISSFFLGFNSDKSRYSSISNFLTMFFSLENKDFATYVYNNILNYIKKESYSLEEYEIPYVVSSLHFFEFIFDNIPENQITTKTNIKIEQDIFRAYVLMNQKTLTERDQKNQELKIKNGRKFKVDEALIEMSFHNGDILNYSVDKLFYTQFFRAYYYFEFLSKQDTCQELLSAFYKYYSVRDYKDYLRRLMGITYSVLMKDREAHTEIHLKESEHSLFIDKHIADISIPITELDFLKVRSNPLYKFEENKYRIISPLFTIEMIYNGLYFRLKFINENILQKKQKVKNLYDLKTYQYSEQFVLSKLLKEIYGNRFIQKSGTDLDAIMDGAPDYYVRNGKYIQVFESKDILITKESKQSIDFTELESELKIKLYENEKGHRKAVKQLVETVKKILLGEAKYDPGLPLKKVHIFPVLVLHYRMFNAPGLNSMINKWFEEELNRLKEKDINITNVHSLIIIDIDTLLFNKDAFVKRRLSLLGTLQEYEKYYLKFHFKNIKSKPKSQQEANAMLQKSFDPFSLFLDNKVDQMKFKRSTDELMELAETLFESDN